MAHRYINGARIIEEFDSPVNGKVRVMENAAWGYFIQVGENVGTLTQSGGLVQQVWDVSLKKLKELNTEYRKNCLILGLGGGSVARLVRNSWPESVITGVELDPIMVDTGMNYLGLGDAKVSIKIQDALEFCNEAIQKNSKFDLILVDIYLQDQVPPQFETEEFVTKVASLVTEHGVVIFNRLYIGEKRGGALMFKKFIEKYFKIFAETYPEANIMFLCSK